MANEIEVPNQLILRYGDYMGRPDPLCDFFSSSDFASWWQVISEIFKEQEGFYEPLLASKMEGAIYKDWSQDDL